jgi:hypothetical protein
VSFETLSLAAALCICQRMRPKDRDCFENCNGTLDDEHFALKLWGTTGAAWHYLQDGLPVAMGGISQPVPWIGIAWMVTAEGVSLDSRKKLMRHSRRVFANASREIPRIEAHVIAGWTEAEQYAQRLGFVLESTRCRAARDGRDVQVYVFERQS